MAEQKQVTAEAAPPTQTSTQSIVAFLGPRATYTHQAALSYFSPESNNPNGPDHDDKFDLVPEPSIAAVVDAVRDSRAAYGVVPYENSTNGAVAATLDLLADGEGASRDLLIVGEVYVPVQHCLLGRRPPATQQQGQGGQQRNEESPYAHIQHLYSHPQAWGQCTIFLSTHLSHATRHDTSSTSRAADIAAEDTSGASAAVANVLAATTSGLDVLAKNIVDDPVGNTTRFLVLRRRRDKKDSANRSAGSQQNQAPQVLERPSTSTTLLSFIPKSKAPSRDTGILPILTFLSQQRSCRGSGDGQQRTPAPYEITKVHSRPSPAFTSTTTPIVDSPSSPADTARKRKPWEYTYLVELLRREGTPPGEAKQGVHPTNSSNGEGESEDVPDHDLQALLVPSSEQAGLQSSFGGGGQDGAPESLSDLVESLRWLGTWEDRLDA
jgi:prephenate dehydratase